MPTVFLQVREERRGEIALTRRMQAPVDSTLGQLKSLVAPSDLLAWGGSAPPPSVPVRSTFKTLFKQQQLVQKREEERAEAAALESKATKRLANMASIAASKSMRSMPGLAR